MQGAGQNYFREIDIWALIAARNARTPARRQLAWMMTGAVFCTDTVIELDQ